jgi:hypothetical protein
MTPDSLVYFGDAVKALDDSGRVGGYLVRYGDASTPDISSARDYFDKSTNFGPAEKLPILYDHGLNPRMDDRVLGVGSIKADDVGIWLEGELNLRDGYEKAIFGMVKAGKLGWSSGAVSHAVRRAKKDNGTHHLKTWFIGEASLTPRPANPELMSAAVPIKAFIEDSARRDDPAIKSLLEELGTPNPPESPPGEVASPTLFDRLDASVADAEEVQALVDRAVKSRGDRGLSAPKRVAVAEFAATLKGLSDALAALSGGPDATATPATPPTPVPASDAAKAADLDDLVLRCRVTLTQLRLQD